MQLIWQPISDPVAWADLCIAAERIDHTGEIYTADDLAEEIDEAADGSSILVGVWADGAMVGYAGVRPRDSGRSPLRVEIEGTVHPAVRRHGIGGQLLDWAIRVATGHRDASCPDLPAEVLAVGYLDNPDQYALLTARGFQTRSWEALLERRIDPSSPVQRPAPLEGFRVEPYDRDRSDAVRTAHNLAFGTYPTYAPWSAALWRQWVDDTQAARPELSLVAYGPSGTVVSYVISQEYDGVRQLTGRRDLYISKVGTLEEFRGRGLARSLLMRVVAEAAEAGFDQISLHADVQNPTGAFGLYESAGFVEVRRLERMVRIIAPSTAQPTGTAPAVSATHPRDSGLTRYVR
jgi:mycothiol synthase